MFIAGWRHALRSEWPFIIIIIRFKWLSIKQDKFLVLFCYSRPAVLDNMSIKGAHVLQLQLLTTRPTRITCS